MMKCVIIIPVYKSFAELTNSELLSFQQTIRILSGNDIFLIGAHNQDFRDYQQNGDEHGIRLQTKTFENSFFKGVTEYSRLLISRGFYNAFINFHYMLICQLDVWVFKDELGYWCNQGYDYIGAPWTGFKNYKKKPLLGVGNGGFSLRHVRKSFELLRKLRVFEVLYSYRLLDNKAIILRLPVILKKLIKAPKIESEFEKGYRYFEDIFWCKGVEERVNSNDFNSSIVKLMVKILVHYDFKIAPVEIASRFSIEVDPKRYFELNNRELPFGCHAWEKYDPEFWKEFIPARPTALS